LKESYSNLGNVYEIPEEINTSIGNRNILAGVCEKWNINEIEIFQIVF